MSIFQGLILTPSKTILQEHKCRHMHGRTQIQLLWSIFHSWSRCLNIESNVHLNFRDRLSVADAVVLEQHLGLNKAANFVTNVDPWRYPHDHTPGSLKVISCVQSVVAQAAHAGKTWRKFTDASISDFLLSPLLVKKGDRPPLVVKPRAHQSTQSPRTVITAGRPHTVLSSCQSSNYSR